MKGSRVFIDSNIWCYLLDHRETDKLARARETVDEIGRNGRIVLSTQVLNETYAVATGKLKVDPLAAKAAVKQMGEHEVVIVDQSVISQAIDVSILEQISYWDALMVAAAMQARCATLLTEDLQHGSKIQGILVRNPFLPGHGS